MHLLLIIFPDRVLIDASVELGYVQYSVHLSFRGLSIMQSILYVMRHIDIGGHIEIPYKKVGITGAGNATLDSRLP